MWIGLFEVEIFLKAQVFIFQYCIVFNSNVKETLISQILNLFTIFQYL